MPGADAPLMPSFENAFQFRSATLVYTSGTFTPYFRASFCGSGKSGQRYGIIMFQHARTTPPARTAYRLFSRAYVTSTSFADADDPTCFTRTAVLLNRIRTFDAARSSFA